MMWAKIIPDHLTTYWQFLAHCVVVVEGYVVLALGSLELCETTITPYYMAFGEQGFLLQKFPV